MNEQNGHRSMAMSPSIENLAVALIAAQTSLPKVPKDKTNPFFGSSYAGLDTVLPAALGVLTSHGLGLVQSVGEDSQGNTTLTTVLMHKSGEWYADTQPLLLVKADPQGQGSAITYARRYAVMSLLGLVAEEDDDGNKASVPSRQPQGSRPAPPQGQQRGNVMKAKFRGECVKCGFVIKVGEECIYQPATKTIIHPGDCPDPYAQAPAQEGEPA